MARPVKEPIPVQDLDTAVKNKADRELIKSDLITMAAWKGQEKEAKDQIDKIKGPLTERLLKYSIRKTELEGFTHTLVPGCNVSIAEEAVRRALLKRKFDPDEINEFLGEVVKRTEYYSVQSRAIKEEE